MLMLLRVGAGTGRGKQRGTRCITNAELAERAIEARFARILLDSLAS